MKDSNEKFNNAMRKKYKKKREIKDTTCTRQLFVYNQAQQRLKHRQLKQLNRVNIKRFIGLKIIIIIISVC